MEIVKNAVAGTLESSDIYVQIEPSDTLEIEINSVVLNQFGEEIRQCVMKILEENKVIHAKITLQDKGALNCVIKARIETAIKRAGGEY